MHVLVRMHGEVEEFICGFKDTSREKILLDLKNAVSWAEFRDDGFINVAGGTYLLREITPMERSDLQKLFGTAEPALVA